MAVLRGEMVKGSSGSGSAESVSPQMYTAPSGRGYTSGSVRCPVNVHRRATQGRWPCEQNLVHWF